MKFTYDRDTATWISACGNYFVWKQGSPRDELPEWAAQYKLETPWLTALAGSKAEAFQICREHAKGLQQRD